MNSQCVLIMCAGGAARDESPLSWIDKRQHRWSGSDCSDDMGSAKSARFTSGTARFLFVFFNLCHYVTGCFYTLYGTKLWSMAVGICVCSEGMVHRVWVRCSQTFGHRVYMKSRFFICLRLGAWTSGWTRGVKTWRTWRC